MPGSIFSHLYRNFIGNLSSYEAREGIPQYAVCTCKNFCHTNIIRSIPNYFSHRTIEVTDAAFYIFPFHAYFFHVALNCVVSIHLCREDDEYVTSARGKASNSLSLTRIVFLFFWTPHLSRLINLTLEKLVENTF